MHYAFITYKTPTEGTHLSWCVLFIYAMKQTDPFYLSTRWEHLRQKIMRRDNYMCRECLRFGRHRQGEMVHHAIPREDFPELEWTAWNLVTLCNACHERMHLRVSNELSQAGIDLATRILRSEGKDIGYLRELERRRTEGARMV